VPPARPKVSVLLLSRAALLPGRKRVGGTITTWNATEIHADAAVYYLTYSYLTYSVVEWLPVFVSQASCQIVTESLSFCHRAKELRVNAYVIMPSTCL
jgi:hypothetical protein